MSMEGWAKELSSEEAAREAQLRIDSIKETVDALHERFDEGKDRVDAVVERAKEL